jgi:hypothetical protein
MSSYEDSQTWAIHSHRPPYRPTLLFWLAPALFTFVGVLSLFMYASSAPESVPESELTFVKGVPSSVEFGELNRRRGSVETLSFVVGGYKTYISEFHPNYKEVRAAVQQERPLKVWLETSKTYSGDDSKPLYKLMAGNRMLVTYDDTVEQQAEAHKSLLVVGIALLIGGAALAFRGLLQQRRYNAYVDMLQQPQPVG